MDIRRRVIVLLLATGIAGCSSESVPSGISVTPQRPPSVSNPRIPHILSILPSDPVLVVGDTLRLTAVDELGPVTDLPAFWSSLDPAIVTIGETDGLVTAKAVGSTTVRVNVAPLYELGTVTVIPRR